MIKKTGLTFLMLFIAAQLFAQDQKSSFTQSLHSAGKIYVVVICVMIILLGLIFFLFAIDRRIKMLEKKSEAKN